MPLLNVKLIEGVFSPAQKQEMIRKLTDTMVSIEGENLRSVTWVVIEEVQSGDWGVGGNPLTTSDVMALAIGQNVGEHSEPDLATKSDIPTLRSHGVPAMRVRNLIPLVLVCLAGCTPAPVMTKGNFTTTYTLTMQRGSVDVEVQTSGPASYTITQYQMNHPMGRRPDTEATFVTPAGTFAVSNRNLLDAGLNINGVFYAEPDVTGRSTITIDAKGVITVNRPKAAAP